MTTHPNLQIVTGENTAEKPDEHAIAVVGIGFPLPKTLTIRTGDLHAFVDHYDISRATPFMNMRIRPVLNMILKARANKQTPVKFTSVSPVYTPVGQESDEEAPRQFFKGLSGKTWFIVEHTFKDLRLDPKELKALPLTMVERFVLNSVIFRYRLQGVPFLIYIDLEG